MVTSPCEAIAVASKIGSHIKANNIASSDLFLSVCVPATAAIDDLQRLILSAPAPPHEPGLLRPLCCASWVPRRTVPASRYHPAPPWRRALSLFLTLNRTRDGQLPRSFHH